MNFLLPPEPNFKCSTCHKEYKRKDYYKKHVMMCDMLHNEKNSEETMDMPSMYQMYVMIQELTKKYTECKNECKMLRSKLAIIEKKTNTEDLTPQQYAEKHKRCDVDYSTWIENLQINNSDIKNIIDLNIIHIVCKIIKNEHDYNSPIIAFKNKRNNIIMIYNGKHWENLHDRHICNLFESTITPKMLEKSIYFDSDTSSKIVNILAGKSYSDSFCLEFRTTLFKSIQQVKA
jgi:hypothetical protein